MKLEKLANITLGCIFTWITVELGRTIRTERKQLEQENENYGNV